MKKWLIELYDWLVLSQPKIVAGIVAILALFFAFYIPKFELSASSDQLVLEGDEDLDFYREIKEKYGSEEFLVITYSPKNGKELFDADVLLDIEILTNDIREIDGIQAVTSLLNVPLINSPKISFQDIIKKNIKNLSDEGVDIKLAQKELMNSPLYSNLLTSPNGNHTAILVTLEQNEKYNNLIKDRKVIFDKRKYEKLTKTDQENLKSLNKAIKIENSNLVLKQEKIIKQIREIMSRHENMASSYLGGVPMIVVDSVNFIKKDVVTFGIAVILFIIALLFVTFRSMSIIVAAVTISLIVTIILVGLLGFIEWPVTIVSSNFISLILIITLSVIIHLTVSFREFHYRSKKLSYKELTKRAIHKMFKPCLYTSVTTMVAFSSLIISGIKPVIDFGWIMVIAIAISFICCFLLYSPLIQLLKPKPPKIEKDFTAKITGAIAKIVQVKPMHITIVFAIFTLISIIGIAKLTVENRFIDYYKKSTEIYKGMELIDKNFGGTTPIDIVIDAPASYFLEKKEEDSFNIFYMEENETLKISDGYWFNSFKLEQIDKIHDYLESVPEIGKTLSFATTVKLLTIINDNQPVDGFLLNAAFTKASKSFKDSLFTPYISEDGNQIRFSSRVYESSYLLNRQELINKLNKDLVNKFGLEEEQFHINGMVVLYNNILKSLFKSQILTLSFVFIVIGLMFLILFRNIKIAILTLIPNIVTALLLLGLIGFLYIPLDIMTITIAAICVGISVDDSIHYVHRFLNEYKLDKNYNEAVKRSHISIGRAMYYTTVTITFGFSILTLSNFVPTIYFGILTGLSMVIALIANITLLPVLMKFAKEK